ncbi:MAG: hypothetical protein JWN86_704 [Planctomycetota bacterium]|nr:hypothetical protein [Planctomycetota bacterium]
MGEDLPESDPLRGVPRDYRRALGEWWDQWESTLRADELPPDAQVDVEVVRTEDDRPVFLFLRLSAEYDERTFSESNTLAIGLPLDGQPGWAHSSLIFSLEDMRKKLKRKVVKHVLGGGRGRDPGPSDGRSQE